MTPRITIHHPWDRTTRTVALPDRFDTVAQAASEARRNGATVHGEDEPCPTPYCPGA